MELIALVRFACSIYPMPEADHILRYYRFKDIRCG